MFWFVRPSLASQVIRSPVLFLYAHLWFNSCKDLTKTMLVFRTQCEMYIVEIFAPFKFPMNVLFLILYLRNQVKEQTRLIWCMKFIDSCTFNYLFRSQWVGVRNTNIFFSLNLATSSSISDKAGVKPNNDPREIMENTDPWSLLKVEKWPFCLKNNFPFIKMSSFYVKFHFFSFFFLALKMLKRSL